MILIIYQSGPVDDISRVERGRNFFPRSIPFSLSFFSCSTRQIAKEEALRLSIMIMGSMCDLEIG